MARRASKRFDQPTGLILGRTGAAKGRTIGFQGKTIERQSDELITYAGDGHLITFAPTGTGKTSGSVICNALTHPGQLIVLDIKGEVYKHTAATRRAMGQEVQVLDLRDGGDEKGALNSLDLARPCGTDIPAVWRERSPQRWSSAPARSGTDFGETRRSP